MSEEHLLTHFTVMAAVCTFLTAYCAVRRVYAGSLLCGLLSLGFAFAALIKSI